MIWWRLEAKLVVLWAGRWWGKWKQVCPWALREHGREIERQLGQLARSFNSWLDDGGPTIWPSGRNGRGSTCSANINPQVPKLWTQRMVCKHWILAKKNYVNINLREVCAERKRWVWCWWQKESEMVNCRSVLEETVNNYQQNALQVRMFTGTEWLPLVCTLSNSEFCKE